MPTPLSVLILEDRPTDAELMLYELRRAGFEPHGRRVDTEQDYIASLEPDWDVILADYSLPQFNALRALHLLKERGLDIPFIVVTGSIGEEAAVECMKQGASDYLLKDRLARLGSAVTHSLEQKRLRDERRRAEQLLRAFNQAAMAMERALTPEQIFAAVAGELGKLGLACALFPADESGKRLFPRYVSYEPNQIEALERLAGIERDDFAVDLDVVDLFRRALDERRPILVERVEEMVQALLPAPAKQLAGQMVAAQGLAVCVIAPLVMDDRVIGLFSVGPGDLTEADVPAVTAFAHQVAAAWHKVQLLRDLETSLEELRRTQDQLLQAQKMEAVGRLAGGVAHDFNNLLTAINGYTWLLLKGLRPDDPWRSDAEEIKKAVDAAAALTGQLLAFSRKQILQPKVLDLNVMIANIERMLRRLLGEDIEFVTVLDPDLGCIEADPGQIDQVIINLAVNARDAMPYGGVLTIETHNVHLDEGFEVQPGPYVLMAIRDTGVGMDDEIQSHLFEPFFTTKEVNKGTGLGLATVYGIVKQSGGHIDVHSQVGRGTTFRIYLPRVAKTAEVVTRSYQVAGLSQGRETILLVEDSDQVRSLTREILIESGYAVLEARDSEEAFHLCQGHKGPIHLLLADVVVPGMGGRELAERLAPAQPGMRVLFMSGHTDDMVVHRGVSERGMAFLQKPFGPEELAAKVREVLDRA